MSRRVIEPRATRPGFTAAELLLALALSVVVSGAAISLIGTVTRADSVAQKRFEGEAELQGLYRAVRNLSRSVAARRLPDSSAGGPQPSESDLAPIIAELREKMTNAGQPFTEESLRQQAYDQARANLAQKAASAGDERETLEPRFDLRLDASGYGGAVPVLEAVVTEPPVPPAWSPESVRDRMFEAAPVVRGVIEGVRAADFEKDGWNIQWRQVEPPAEPIVIARRVKGWEWTVLPRKKHAKDSQQWAEVASAWYGQDFPRALRMRVLMMTGAAADWLFDIPRPIAEIADPTEGEAFGEQPGGDEQGQDNRDGPPAKAPTRDDPNERGGAK